jgi:hypothetical protein
MHHFIKLKYGGPSIVPSGESHGFSQPAGLDKAFEASWRVGCFWALCALAFVPASFASCP